MFIQNGCDIGAEGMQGLPNCIEYSNSAIPYERLKALTWLVDSTRPTARLNRLREVRLIFRLRNVFYRIVLQLACIATAPNRSSTKINTRPLLN